MSVIETFTLNFMTGLYVSLNILVLSTLAIYIFLLLYYDFDKKRIKKKLKDFTKKTRFRTLADKIFEL